MQDNRSQEITTRFWQAFEELRKKHGRGFQSQFIKEANTNIGNFLRLKREPWREFELGYLALICSYGVSSDWLINGRGEMMK